MTSDAPQSHATHALRPADGRWFSHCLFGMCGKAGPCPSAAPAAEAGLQAATPRWRDSATPPKKAA